MPKTIHQAIATATGSEKKEFIQEGSNTTLEFYHPQLKIGDENDDDGNDDELFATIKAIATKIMLRHYPKNKNFTVQSIEKGYWSLTIKE
jgi:hypothetical protein